MKFQLKQTQAPQEIISNSMKINFVLVENNPNRIQNSKSKTIFSINFRIIYQKKIHMRRKNRLWL